MCNSDGNTAIEHDILVFKLNFKLAPKMYEVQCKLNSGIRIINTFLKLSAQMISHMIMLGLPSVLTTQGS